MSEISDDIMKVASALALEVEKHITPRRVINASGMEAIARAILAERERCAKVAESCGDTWSGTRDAMQAVQEAAVDKKCTEIAAAIRGQS